MRKQIEFRPPKKKGLKSRNVSGTQEFSFKKKSFSFLFTEAFYKKNIKKGDFFFRMMILTPSALRHL